MYEYARHGERVRNVGGTMASVAMAQMNSYRNVWLSSSSFISTAMAIAVLMPSESGEMDLLTITHHDVGKDVDECHLASATTRKS